MAKIQENPTNNKPIKDLTHWLSYIDDKSEALAELVGLQQERISHGGSGATYAQRDLQAIREAFTAYNEFKEAAILQLNDLADAYLAERAKAMAYERRSAKLWDTAFSGAMALASELGEKLDAELSTKKRTR